MHPGAPRTPTSTEGRPERRQDLVCVLAETWRRTSGSDHSMIAVQRRAGKTDTASVEGHVDEEPPLAQVGVRGELRRFEDGEGLQARSLESTRSGPIRRGRRCTNRSAALWRRRP